MDYFQYRKFPMNSDVSPSSPRAVLVEGAKDTAMTREPSVATNVAKMSLKDVFDIFNSIYGLLNVPFAYTTTLTVTFVRVLVLFLTFQSLELEIAPVQNFSSAVQFVNRMSKSVSGLI